MGQDARFASGNESYAGHSGRKSSDCSICFGPHDEEIHVATLSVREWLRHEIARKLTSIEEDASERVA
jgi:hypothetical protein